MADQAEDLRADVEELDDEHQEMVQNKLIKLTSELYGHAAAYDNAIIIAGYAAFFALWSGVSGQLSPFCRLITVALMGTSLMFFIGWQIACMLTRQHFDRQRAKNFSFANEPKRFNEAWIDTERRAQIAGQRILRFYPFTLTPSVALGFAAGITLAYNALAIAFGWPQLTG